MRLHVPVIVTLLGTIAAGACNRAETTADSARPAAAGNDEARSGEVAQFDEDLVALEREWAATRERITDEAASGTAAATAAIEEELMALRQEIAELRTTTAQNWWERQERQLERSAERLEQNVRRVAREWPSGDGRDGTATSGTDADWRSRRDALVRRLENQVRDMEQALQGLDPRDAAEPAADDTRRRVQQMKEDTDRLRTASEDEWWELTKARVRASLERLDAAIDRLASGRT